MKITFLGATKEVTGSNILIDAAGKKILVDCGLIQGKDADEEKNFDPFLYDPSQIDYLLLTHAHIDHSGRIPKLYKEGFRGIVYATKATIDLCEIMLADSGYIQESEAEWKNRKRKRHGKVLFEPLYTAKDAEACMEVFSSIPYGEIYEITENIRVRYNDAGHMLGSAIIELWVTEEGITTKSVFTGDLGNDDIPLLDSPATITSADYLIMESTYGDRLHQQNNNKAEMFLDAVSRTLKRGGNVVIPSFAVGRTQEILYEINKIKEEKGLDSEFANKYKELMNAKVYVDSPLATNATSVFRENANLFEESIKEEILNGNSPLEFEGLTFTKTTEESKALNEDKEPKIIISASGMCDAGRIKHHLKHNLWNPLNTILFVGYQAAGTLGRRIVDGAKVVKIFGEEIAVNAEIQYIEGFSGHADQEALIEFVGNIKAKPKAIFLVHGDFGAQKVLKQKILSQFEIPVEIPSFGDAYDIAEIVRKMESVKHLELQNRRDEKLAFVDVLDVLGDKLVDLISRLRDYMIADSTFNQDQTIKQKEQEYLKKVLETTDAFKEELEFKLEQSNSNNTKIEILKPDNLKWTKGKEIKIYEEDKEDKDDKDDKKDKDKEIQDNEKINKKQANKDYKEKESRESKDSTDSIKNEQKEQEKIVIGKKEEDKSLKSSEEKNTLKEEKKLAEIETGQKTLEQLMKEVEEADRKLREEQKALEELKNSKKTKEEIKQEIEDEIEKELEELQEESKLEEKSRKDSKEEEKDLEKTKKAVEDFMKNMMDANNDEQDIIEQLEQLEKIDNLDMLDDEYIKQIKEKIAKIEGEINS